MRCFGTFVVVEPNSSLKLVSSVQKQHVLLLSPDLRHFGEPPGDPGEAGTLGRTLPRVHAGLLDPRMVIVGVQQRQLEGRRCAQTVQKEAEGSQESAPTRPDAHRVAVRKNAPVTKNVQHMNKAWAFPL